MPLWKRFRHWLEAAALRLVAWWVPRLSRRRCVRLANALGEIAYRLDARGRAVALDNLRCAFADLSAQEREEIARESYRNFARTILDLFWAPAFQKPENRRWVRIEQWPRPAEMLGNGQPGILFLTLHFGNWEWANLACGFAGYSFPAVAEHFKNPALTPVFTSLREISGATIIPQENSMLRMLRTVKRGGVTAMLADLTLPPGQVSTIIRAFGLELCVSVLHAVLAQRGGARIIPVIPRPDADGGCTMLVFPPLKIAADASLREIAQKCWDFYEPHIRENPGLWLWPYKHFRYKPRGTVASYPEYANESGTFEKLRRREFGPA
jgi:KDO2-lipid IV(A) lauroyltransferase